MKTVTLKTPNGEMTVLLSEVVCFGRASEYNAEQVWLRNGITFEVADGTCKAIQEALQGLGVDPGTHPALKRSLGDDWRPLDREEFAGERGAVRRLGVDPGIPEGDRSVETLFDTAHVVGKAWEKLANQRAAGSPEADPHEAFVRWFKEVTDGGLGDVPLAVMAKWAWDAGVEWKETEGEEDRSRLGVWRCTWLDGTYNDVLASSSDEALKKEYKRAGTGFGPETATYLRPAAGEEGGQR